jgi:hypothetical protein
MHCEGFLPLRKDPLECKASICVNQAEEKRQKLCRVQIQEKMQKRDLGLFPLAALGRRSGLFLSLLVQPCGPLQGFACKVHSGKGLPGRPGGVIGKLIRYQGPFLSTGGSRSVLSGW